MKRFIEGEDRSQSTLFPEHLDDYIAEITPYGSLMCLSRSSIYRGSVLKACSLKQRGGPPTHPARGGRRGGPSREFPP